VEETASNRKTSCPPNSGRPYHPRHAWTWPHWSARYRACRVSRPSPRSPQTPWCPLSMMARPPTQYAVQGVRLSPGGPSSQPLNDHWRTSRRAIDDSESQSRCVVCGGCVRVA
jgi:hypothetical protein